MSIRADSMAAHGAEGRNGGDVRLGELQFWLPIGLVGLFQRFRSWPWA